MRMTSRHPDSTTTPAASAPPRGRVVVADDEPCSRLILRASLSCEFDVTCVEDGVDALQAVQQDGADAVVSDVEMPRMSGIDLAAHLKANPATRHVPIILVTGASGPEAAATALEAGADDYVTKPVNRVELLARVRAATRMHRTYQALQESHRELESTLAALHAAQAERLQSAKLESIGELAAGIAHEINTPIQFVGDNTRFLGTAFEELVQLILTYREVLATAGDGGASSDAASRVLAAEESADLAFLQEEVPRAITQSLDGVWRVASLVRAMKEFAHPSSSAQAPADLNQAILSTLTVARNEIKYVADVDTELGELPPVTCHVGDLNQVFLNLLVNAAHAIADRVATDGGRGVIHVSTCREGEHVVVAIRDTGAGIPEAVRSRIFDPFFTTKEVGRGSGQGLTIARSIVVDKHGGSLTFETAPGEGTTFFVRIPLEPALACAGVDGGGT
jgi:signal transduction histidine kinase